MERQTRLEELEQERKELEAAREQGVDKKIIEQKEKEFRKREKVIQMMGEDEEPKFVGRPRKDDPKREEMRKPGPKSELQKKRKLEQDLKKFEEKQIIKEQKRRAKEIEREEKKRAMKAAREAEKAAKEAKSPPKKKRKVKTDEEKRKEKRLSEEKKKIKQEAKEKAKAEKAAKPKYQAHLDFDNLKAGDFFETDDPDNSSPQLVKISFVDKSSESVRGMYWDIVSSHFLYFFKTRFRSQAKSEWRFMKEHGNRRKNTTAKFSSVARISRKKCTCERLSQELILPLA